MTYDTNYPPILITNAPIGAQGGREWSYRSSDSSSIVDTNRYISNGVALGMRVGDCVRVGQRQTPNAVSYHVVATLNTDGSVDLSDNLYVTGSANTD